MDPRLRVPSALRQAGGITATQVAARARLAPDRTTELLEQLIPTQVVTADLDDRGASRYYLNAELAEQWADRATALAPVRRSPRR